MRIWVDADALPGVIRDILFKAARRTGIELVLVANQYLRTPPDKHITALQVPQGFDVADDEIAKRAEGGDLVITSDIPLAAEVIAKGAQVLSPRGEMLTRSNIGPCLNMRDFLDTMRASGEHTGGPPPLGSREKQAFANYLDTIIAKSIKS